MEDNEEKKSDVYNSSLMLLQQMRSLRSTFLFSCSSNNLNDDEDIYLFILFVCTLCKVLPACPSLEKEKKIKKTVHLFLTTQYNISKA